MRDLHKLLLALLVAGICTFVLLFAVAEEETPIPPKPDMAKLALKERDAVTNRAVEERYGLTRDLINQLEMLRNDDGQGKEHIIYLLGVYRVAGAVELLVDMIDYEATIVDPRRRIGRWGPYPAQEALVRIGKPASNEVLGRIASETDPTRRELMCLVIETVEGKKVGRMRLTWKVNEEQDQICKSNLQAAIGHPLFKEEEKTEEKK